MRGFKNDDKPSIITQRRTIYEAHKMYMDGYEEFTLHDMMTKTGVGNHHMSAMISKCVKAGLVMKTGKKTGGLTLYKLTKKGEARGDYYAKYYNQVTDELRNEVEQ